MLEQIFRNFDIVKKHSLNVYRGNGIFEELEIHTAPGLTREEICSFEISQQITLPSSYLELLQRYNGISFFKYSDCRFFDLATSIECSICREEFKNKLLIIGIFYDDYILLDCTDDEGKLYVSFEGIEEVKPLNMNLVEFLEKCFLCNFSPFW